MTYCRGNVSVAMVHDRLWAVGGFSGKTFLNTVEFLDPVTEEWTTYLAVEPKDSQDVSEATSDAKSDAKEESSTSDKELEESPKEPEPETEPEET